MRRAPFEAYLDLSSSLSRFLRSYKRSLSLWVSSLEADEDNRRGSSFAFRLSSVSLSTNSSSSSSERNLLSSFSRLRSSIRRSFSSISSSSSAKDFLDDDDDDFVGLCRSAFFLGVIDVSSSSKRLDVATIFSNRSSSSSSSAFAGSPLAYVLVDSFIVFCMSLNSRTNLSAFFSPSMSSSSSSSFASSFSFFASLDKNAFAFAKRPRRVSSSSASSSLAFTPVIDEDCCSSRSSKSFNAAFPHVSTIKRFIVSI